MSRSKSSINDRWAIQKRASARYRSPPKKPIPLTREQELAAMEKFIAKKGVTICEPDELEHTQSILQYVRPGVMP